MNLRQREHGDGDSAPERGPRSAAVRAVLAVIALALFGAFMALGVWQVERRAWKLALIDSVDQRVHAAPVDAPGPASWPTFDATSQAYRHVRLTGTFDHAHETLVQASTARGAGFWVLTPLRLAGGGTVLVNRGFVPPERREPANRDAGPQGEVGVTGLLRASEPGGMFPRRNDPAIGRWFSRDVPAIAAARGLGAVAPYFVDADATPGGEGAPVGGLTVIAFSNSHLVYALTWFGLALMVALGAGYVAREELRLSRRMRAGRPGDNGSSRPGDDPDADPHP
ncbi:SURF1 family protein [Variovorax sp. LT1R16]|uniref:SURF1 family protein n=1 Tax=Variovorax sp. LT1R16 TaxID=3443728 RepID=UPI003F47A83B